MSLVFNNPGRTVVAKPDNSPTFFSCRQSASSVFELSGAIKRTCAHPWCYFVAAGESLAKIDQVIAEAGAVNDDLKALAAEVGAKSADYDGFVFSNAEDEVLPTQIRLRYTADHVFVCKAAAPGDFFPDLDDQRGVAIKRDIIAIQGLPAGEVEAARQALADKYKAASFDGQFFHFEEWEERVEAAPKPHEKKFRLKCNPLFVRGQHDRCYFNPDPESDEGLRIGSKLNDILGRRYAERSFAQWVSSFELDISLSGRSSGGQRLTPEAEKIGDEWIIKVPVVTEGIYGADGKGGSLTGMKEGWVLPPGAKPISISEYFAKLERTGALRLLPSTSV